MTPRGPAALGLAAVVLCACGVYAGCLGSDFVWDDPIVLDRQLPYFDGAGAAFFPPRGVPELAPDYYRPLVIVSYLVDDALARALFPSDVARGRRVVFHATPVLAHGVVSGMVFLLGLSLWGWGSAPPGSRGARPAPAVLRTARVGHSPTPTSGRGSLPSGIVTGAVAGLLFAVHPIHVESVAWMAGRSDVLCALFFLAVPLALLRYRETGAAAWLVAAAAAALLAMLAKEAGAGSLLVAGAVLALRPGRRRIPLEAGLFAAAALAYAGLRRAALGGAGEAALGAGLHLERLPGALGWYALKVVWPWPQSAFVGRVPGGLFAALGLAVAAAAIAGWVVLRRRGDVAGRIALALFFGGLAVSLTTALFPIGVTPLAERYLYVPSAGVCLGVGLLAGAVAVSVVAVAAVVGAAVALLGAATVGRAAVWSDDLAFWEDTARKAPEDALPRFFLGVVYAGRGRAAEAEAAFRAALERDPDPDGRARILNNLGFLLLNAKRYPEAAARFRESLAIDPAQDSALVNLALALLSEDGPAHAEEARGLLEAALAINPRSAATAYQLGQLLVRMGRPAEAQARLRRVVELAPESREAERARALLARLAAGAPTP